MDMLHVVISILTYPGIVLHLVLKQFFCRILHCKIKEIKYFSFNRPCTFIDNEELSSVPKYFWICFLPFILMFIIGTTILLPPSLELFQLGNINFKNVFLYWIAFSILSNMFPEYNDAKLMWKNIYQNKKSSIWMKILLAPICSILFAGSWLMYMGLSWIISILLTLILPLLMLVIQ